VSNIFLGDLNLSDIVKDEYLNRIQGFLDNNGFKKISNTSEVKNKVGNYHIYDIPRCLVICSKAKTEEFYNFLINENLIKDAFIGTVQLAVEELANV